MAHPEPLNSLGQPAWYTPEHDAWLEEVYGMPADEVKRAFMEHGRESWPRPVATATRPSSSPQRRENRVRFNADPTDPVRRRRDIWAAAAETSARSRAEHLARQEIPYAGRSYRTLHVMNPDGERHWLEQREREQLSPTSSRSTRSAASTLTQPRPEPRVTKPRRSQTVGERITEIRAFMRGKQEGRREERARKRWEKEGGFKAVRLD